MQSKTFKSAVNNFHYFALLLSIKFILSTFKYGGFAFLTFFISISIVVLLYRFTVNLRDKTLNGVISYAESFKHIFLLYIFGSIISSLVIFIYTGIINKDFLAIILDTMLKVYRQFNIPIDNATYNFMEKAFTPGYYTLLNFVTSIFLGTFWALILSVSTKKDKNIFDN